VRRAVALLALLFTLPALAVEPSEVLSDPALEARARTIGQALRCVVCQNQSIDDSAAEVAHDMRRAVRERLTAGDSNDQVFAFMVARYGDYVLLKPPFKSGTLVLWLGAPLLLLLRCAVEPGRLVHVIRADHRTWLKDQHTGAFDVVLLDPMFRRAGEAGPLFELLRTYAEHTALAPETLREAQRVARRGVLVKDSARGEELRRLGLAPRPSRRSAAIAFGRPFEKLAQLAPRFTVS